MISGPGVSGVNKTFTAVPDVRKSLERSSSCLKIKGDVVPRTFSVGRCSGPFKIASDIEIDAVISASKTLLPLIGSVNGLRKGFKMVTLDWLEAPSIDYEH